MRGDSLIDELAGYAKIEAEEDSTGYVRIKLEDSSLYRITSATI